MDTWDLLWVESYKALAEDQGEMQFFHFRFEFWLHCVFVCIHPKPARRPVYLHMSSLYVTHGHVVNHGPKTFLKYSAEMGKMSNLNNMCLHIKMETGWSFFTWWHERYLKRPQKRNCFCFVFFTFLKHIEVLIYSDLRKMSNRLKGQGAGQTPVSGTPADVVTRQWC